MNRRDWLRGAAGIACAGRAAVPRLSAAGRSAQAGKARLKTALCAYSFRKALEKKTMTYEDLVDLAVEAGIDGLDLTVYWFPSEGLDTFLPSLRRKAFVSAVEIPSIAIRSDLCKGDPGEQRQEANHLHSWVDIAERLGAGHIRVFGGTVPPGASEDQAARWVIEILGRAADYAGQRGVILGLENHGGITMHAERIVEIVHAVDNPWVGINLDTGNFRSDPYAQIQRCIPYTVHCQFKVTLHYEDGRREPCDWERITKMLAEAGYKGYLSLEYEEKEDPADAVPGHLKTLRGLARKYST